MNTRFPFGLLPCLRLTDTKNPAVLGAPAPLRLVSFIVGIFGNLKLTVSCLGWLIVLTFFGTLHQTFYGLHDSLGIYFSSWFLFVPAKYVAEIGPESSMALKALAVFVKGLGYVPFPGGMLTMTLLFFNLVVSLFIHFVIGWRMAGLIMSHVGLLMLLGGGFLNRLTGKEGYVYLFENEGTNLMTAYTEWELSVWSEEGMPREVTAMPTHGWKAGHRFVFDDIGLEGTVETYLFHADAFLRGREVANPPESVSKIIALEVKKAEMEPERHIPGGIFNLSWKGENRRVLLYGMDEKPTEWNVGDDRIFLMLRRLRTELPLFIHLDDFKRETWPGSNTAKAFSSAVEVTLGNDMSREVVIEMNRPFRHLGYTFFQASFSSDESGLEASKFAVTQSFGRLLPYIATGVVFVGLLWHFLSLVSFRKKAAS
jgi:hypothetical protein